MAFRTGMAAPAALPSTAAATTDPEAHDRPAGEGPPAGYRDIGWRGRYATVIVPDISPRIDMAPPQPVLPLPQGFMHWKV